MDHRFDPFPKGGAVQQDAPATDLALEANVGADAHHAPLVAAAGVGFA